MADTEDKITQSNDTANATPKVEKTEFKAEQGTGKQSSATGSSQKDRPNFSERRAGGGRDNRFNRDRRGYRGGGNREGRGDRPGGRDRGGKPDRHQRRKEEEEISLHTEVITVKRITRVVKGGKRMRFAALVVAGDKAGNVGFGFKKGLDYQDAVKKATKQASKNLIKVELSDHKSIAFPTNMKFKSSKIFLKPAFTGTGLIAGGFIRPVLELAGIENIYSKIIGSRNKVTGVQATFEALKKYSA